MIYQRRRRHFKSGQATAIKDHLCMCTGWGGGGLQQATGNVRQQKLLVESKCSYTQFRTFQTLAVYALTDLPGKERE